MDDKLKEQLDGLLEKYTELLLGETDPELKEKVQAWVLYMHISKQMPPLTKHWNTSYPDAKEKMRELVAEIKEMNEAHNENNKKDQS